MANGIIQLEQFANGQDPPSIDFSHVASSEQQLYPNVIELEDEPPSSNEEDLASLLAKFAVKRGAPASSSFSATTTPQSRKRKLGNDLYSTPEHPLPSISLTYTREKLTPASMANFYREHAGQLSKRRKHASLHEWTFKEREALCLICTFYEVDAASEDITKVINEYFQVSPGASFRPAQLNA